MTNLKKSCIFFRELYSAVLALFVILICLLVLTFKVGTGGKLIILFVFFVLAVLLLVYYLINHLKRNPAIKFNENSICFGNTFYQWKDFSSIIINTRGYYRGLNYVITSMFNGRKEIKILNRNYKNIELLTTFLVNENITKQILHIEPKREPIIKNQIIGNKTYPGYRLSTHLFAVTYLFVFLCLFIIMPHKSGTSMFFMFVLAMLVFFIFYLPNYTEVEDGSLLIKKLFLKHTVAKYSLDDIYSINYVDDGSARSSLRKLMIVCNNFKFRKFYMETLPYKKIKELRNDLRSTGIIFYDFLESQGINLKANYSFNLFGKKKKKAL